MAYYKDLREYLEVLERRGKLTRIDFPVNKDTELHPLVRLQYRGLPAAERRAFLFQHVTDAHARRYSVPYAICCLAGNREIYAIGMNCDVTAIADLWRRAQAKPIPPVILPAGPVHEEVHAGKGLLEHGGLDEFPIAISTPGFDSAAYLTSGCWITKDPETGARNVGVYRTQIKAPDRTGVFLQSQAQGMAIHLAAARRLGRPLEAALVLGPTPNVAYVACTPLPHGVDEIAVAGGIAGEPVPLVKCRTIDVEVPATAEIVLEGLVSPDVFEPEAPFGEGLGFMGPRQNSFFFDLKCITHRRNPIMLGFLSQFPPAEDTVLRGVAVENQVNNYLAERHGIAGILEIAAHEPSCAGLFYVIRVARAEREAARRIVAALSQPEFQRVAYFAKVLVLVDEGIDAWDADAVNWAIGALAQPHRDMHIIRRKTLGSTMDYSIEPASALAGRDPSRPLELDMSTLVIDATMKWDYPPISLPKQEYMELARAMWAEAGLPQLNLKKPWYGYSLGYWGAQDEEEAQLAVQGDYYKTGVKAAGRRQRA